MARGNLEPPTPLLSHPQLHLTLQWMTQTSQTPTRVCPAEAPGLSSSPGRLAGVVHRGWCGMRVDTTLWP